MYEYYGQDFGYISLHREKELELKDNYTRALRAGQYYIYN